MRTTMPLQVADACASGSGLGAPRCSPWTLLRATSPNVSFTMQRASASSIIPLTPVRFVVTVARQRPCVNGSCVAVCTSSGESTDVFHGSSFLGPVKSGDFDRSPFPPPAKSVDFDQTQSPPPAKSGDFDRGPFSPPVYSVDFRRSPFRPPAKCADFDRRRLRGPAKSADFRCRTLRCGAPRAAACQVR